MGGFDDAAVRAWMHHWLATGLVAVEQRLATESATGRFCHGDVTMADICLASILAVTRLFKLEFDRLPNVERIVAECDAIDAFARAAPLRQEGRPRRERCRQVFMNAIRPSYRSEPVHAP